MAKEPTWDDTEETEIPLFEDTEDLGEPSTSISDKVLDSAKGASLGLVGSAGIHGTEKVLSSPTALSAIGPISREQIKKIQASPEAYRSARTLQDIVPEIAEDVQDIKGKETLKIKEYQNLLDEYKDSAVGKTQSIKDISLGRQEDLASLTREAKSKAPQELEAIRDLGKSKASEAERLLIDSGISIPAEERKGILKGATESFTSSEGAIDPSVAASIKSEKAYIAKLKDLTSDDVLQEYKRLSRLSKSPETGTLYKQQFGALKDYMKDSGVSGLEDFMRLKGEARETFGDIEELQKTIGVSESSATDKFVAKGSTESKIHSFLEDQSKYEDEIKEIDRILEKYGRDPLFDKDKYVLQKSMYEQALGDIKNISKTLNLDDEMLTGRIEGRAATTDAIQKLLDDPVKYRDEITKVNATLEKYGESPIFDVDNYTKIKGEATDISDDVKTLEKRLALDESGIDKKVQSGARTQTRLQQIYKDPTKYQTEIEEIEAILNKYGDTEKLKEADLSRIKQLTKLDLKGTSITRNTILGRVAGTIFGPKAAAMTTSALTLKDILGAKAQAAMAAFPSSAIGKGVKAISKAAKYGLPIIGGVMSYAEAKDKGYSTPEALGFAAAEELSPVPLGEIESAEDAIKRRQLEGFGVKPDEYKKDSEKFKEYGKTFFDADDTGISSISESLRSSSIPAERDFATVLDKVQESTGPKRRATMFGLWQQPAFRRSLYRLKKAGRIDSAGLPEDTLSKMKEDEGRLEQDPRAELYDRSQPEQSEQSESNRYTDMMSELYKNK